jgi:hypothetical protein
LVLLTTLHFLLVTSEHTQVTSEHTHVTREHTHVTSEHTHVTSQHTHVTREHTQVISDHIPEYPLAFFFFFYIPISVRRWFIPSLALQFMIFFSHSHSNRIFFVTILHQFCPRFWTLWINSPFSTDFAQLK